TIGFCLSTLVIFICDSHQTLRQNNPPGSLTTSLPRTAVLRLASMAGLAVKAGLLWAQHVVVALDRSQLTAFCLPIDRKMLTADELCHRWQVRWPPLVHQRALQIISGAGHKRLANR